VPYFAGYDMGTMTTDEEQQQAREDELVEQ
jgi:hypothetical protein